MKYLVLFLLMPVFSSAQKSEVIEDSTIKKADAFGKSLEWVAKTWKSANNVVQMKDADAGTIVVKGGLQSVPRSLGIAAKGLTMTTVTIKVKDGKAKIEFSETHFKWDTGADWKIDEPKSNGQFTKWSESSTKEMEDMIADYKKALLKASDF